MARAAIEVTKGVLAVEAEERKGLDFTSFGINQNPPPPVAEKVA